jgi:cytochrome o ubiquinol oxidase subunit 3
MNRTETEHVRDTSLLGFWLFIMSDCLLFASLFATYAVLGHSYAGGPSASEIFSLPFVLLETLILLTSTLTCGLAVVALYKRNREQILGWLFVTGALGALFLALELHEFVTLIAEGHGFQASAFLSAFFTLVGTHGLHVSIGLLWMLFMMAQVYRTGLTNVTERHLMCLALFWHFLDIVWIFIFSFVYLLPIIV